VHPVIILQPIGKENLLLAFTDSTSGDETYDLGRYLDVHRIDDDKVYIDFNRAYHPYCAYNPGLACPIPPKQNDLPFAIQAGERSADEQL
jgi:uncharacterized protein (DUF1684 family)